MPVKENLQRRLILVLALLLLAGGLALLLNKASFDPNFSVLDAITGSTKRIHRESDGENAAWRYTREDLMLPEEARCEETILDTGETRYRLLWNRESEGTSETIMLLSNREDSDYQRAVRNVTAALENQGYTVRCAAYGETMMLSRAHAGRFDVFILCEEVQP